MIDPFKICIQFSIWDRKTDPVPVPVQVRNCHGQDYVNFISFSLSSLSTSSSAWYIRAMQKWSTSFFLPRAWGSQEFANRKGCQNLRQSSWFADLRCRTGHVTESIDSSPWRERQRDEACNIWQYPTPHGSAPKDGRPAVMVWIHTAMTNNVNSHWHATQKIVLCIVYEELGVWACVCKNPRSVNQNPIKITARGANTLRIHSKERNSGNIWKQIVQQDDSWLLFIHSTSYDLRAVSPWKFVDEWSLGMAWCVARQFLYCSI